MALGISQDHSQGQSVSRFTLTEHIEPDLVYFFELVDVTLWAIIAYLKCLS